MSEKLITQIQEKWDDADRKEQIKRDDDIRKFNRLKNYGEGPLDYLIEQLSGGSHRIKGNLSLEGEKEERKINKAKVVACLSRSRIRANNL